MNDYVILPIGKLIIVNKRGLKQFFIEENQKLRPLTESEYHYVKELFTSEFGYSYNSKRLNTLIINNSKIESKEFIFRLLNWLENRIPEDYRENFYKNMETLSINSNLNIDLNTPLTYESNNSFAGVYNGQENKIDMDVESIKEMWRISKKTKNPEETFSQEYNETLLHELIHMASSDYNKETSILRTGYDTYPARNESEKNRGLTEGMTEAIAMSGVTGTIEIASEYYEQILLVNQLIQIVGSEIMLRSYFSNRGTIEIEKKLNEIISDPFNSYTLFREIEDSYTIRKMNCEQTILVNAQNKLIEYYIKKVELQQQNGTFNIESYINSLDIYERMLITPQILSTREKNPDNYIGLDESISRFKFWKENLLQENKIASEEPKVK